MANFTKLLRVIIISRKWDHSRRLETIRCHLGCKCLPINGVTTKHLVWEAIGGLGRGPRPGPRPGRSDRGHVCLFGYKIVTQRNKAMQRNTAITVLVTNLRITDCEQKRVILGVLLALSGLILKYQNPRTLGTVNFSLNFQNYVRYGMKIQ